MIAREWRRPGLKHPHESTPNRNSTSDDTKRRYVTREGEAEAQGTGDKGKNANSQDRQRPGLPVESSRGGGGGEDGGGRHK